MCNTLRILVYIKLKGNTGCRKNLGRERANLFFSSKVQVHFVIYMCNFEIKKKKMRKVDKTFVLPIYYSLYHNTNLTVNTLLYEIISFQIITIICEIWHKYLSDNTVSKIIIGHRDFHHFQDGCR